MLDVWEVWVEAVLPGDGTGPLVLGSTYNNDGAAFDAAHSWRRDYPDAAVKVFHVERSAVTYTDVTPDPL